MKKLPILILSGIALLTIPACSCSEDNSGETGQKEETKFVITFYQDLGSSVTYEAEDVSGEYTLPNSMFKAPEGQEFSCWLVNGSEMLPGEKVSVSKNLKIIAIRKNKGSSSESDKFTVTFIADNGKNEQKVVEVSASYILPPCSFTAPEGKEFKCWLYNGKEVDAGSTITITSNATIKAIWKNIELDDGEIEILNKFTNLVSDFQDYNGDITVEDENNRMGTLIKSKRSYNSSTGEGYNESNENQHVYRKFIKHPDRKNAYVCFIDNKDTLKQNYAIVDIYDTRFYSSQYENSISENLLIISKTASLFKSNKELFTKYSNIMNADSMGEMGLTLDTINFKVTYEKIDDKFKVSFLQVGNYVSLFDHEYPKANMASSMDITFDENHIYSIKSNNIAEIDVNGQEESKQKMAENSSYNIQYSFDKEGFDAIKHDQNEVIKNTSGFATNYEVYANGNRIEGCQGYVSKEDSFSSFNDYLGRVLGGNLELVKVSLNSDFSNAITSESIDKFVWPDSRTPIYLDLKPAEGYSLLFTNIVRYIDNRAQYLNDFTEEELTILGIENTTSSRHFVKSYKKGTKVNYYHPNLMLYEGQFTLKFDGKNYYESTVDLSTGDNHILTIDKKIYQHVSGNTDSPYSDEFSSLDIKDRILFNLSTNTKSRVLTFEIDLNKHPGYEYHGYKIFTTNTMLEKGGEIVETALTSGVDYTVVTSYQNDLGKLIEFKGSSELPENFKGKIRISIRSNSNSEALFTYLEFI